MGDVSLTLNQDKRRRFDSYPGSISAGGGLLALAERSGQGGYCTLGCAQSLEADAPLPEPEGERELVWRTGHGWVERLVEVAEPDAQREVAAA